MKKCPTFISHYYTHYACENWLYDYTSGQLWEFPWFHLHYKHMVGLLYRYFPVTHSYQRFLYQWRLFLGLLQIVHYLSMKEISCIIWLFCFNFSFTSCGMPSLHQQAYLALLESLHCPSMKETSFTMFFRLWKINRICQLMLWYGLEISLLMAKL